MGRARQDILKLFTVLLLGFSGALLSLYFFTGEKEAGSWFHPAVAYEYFAVVPTELQFPPKKDPSTPGNWATAATAAHPSAMELQAKSREIIACLEFGDLAACAYLDALYPPWRQHVDGAITFGTVPP